MRRARLSNAQQQSTGDYRQTFIPPPTKGWSTTQPRYGGDPRYASTFTNVIVENGEVVTRAGISVFAERPAVTTGKSIFAYKGAAVANDKLFMCADSSIYDVTAGGNYAAGVAAATNGMWEFINFTPGSGTPYLWGVNGTDPAWHWDGAVWANPSITGVASTALFYCWVFKRRIWALEENSMNAWYLPVDSIAGAMTKVPLGPNFARGGRLISAFSWTLDGGNGPDDYCGFVTSEGEVAIYQGTDPSSSSSWGLIGVYFVGKPGSQRCWARVGPDVYIATELGLLSMGAISKGEIPMPESAISGPIWTNWVANWGGEFASTSTCWCVVAHPNKNLLFISFPKTSTGNQQTYIYNLATGVWSYSSGRMTHAAVYGSNLYAVQAGSGGILNFWDTTNNEDDYSGAVTVLLVAPQIIQNLTILAGGREVEITRIRPRFGSALTRNSAIGQAPTGTVNGTNFGTVLSEVDNRVINLWTQPTVSTSDTTPIIGIAPSLTYYGINTYYGCDVQYRFVPAP
jgi:hypothetical protein